MDLVVLNLLTFSFLVCYNGAIGANWNLSKEDDFKIEKQLKLLNKPAIKTIKTEYGELYDCVDFFNQPAFDHPLLKNYTSDFQVIPPSVLTTIRSHRSKKIKEVDNIGLKSLDCPIGTVPIRRVTKQDLIKDYLASKASSLENAQTNYAVVKTKGIARKRYSGTGSLISIHNPKVTGTQYSSARFRVANGPDVIQTGWRVDPSLYHDAKTRLFVHTDAGHTHCFNTRCPGFVVVNHRYPIDTILPNISVVGGPRYYLKLFIIRDEHGNWNLQAGPNYVILGYWPARLFTGLSGLANFLEWGGEIYAPPGSLFPPMGEGNKIYTGDALRDANFMQVLEYNEVGEPIDPDDMIPLTTNFDYFVYDEGVVDNLKHLVIYGGVDHRE